MKQLSIVLAISKIENMKGLSSDLSVHYFCCVHPEFLEPNVERFWLHGVQARGDSSLLALR